MKALRLGIKRDECISTSLKAGNIFLLNGSLRLSFPSHLIDVNCEANTKYRIEDSIAGLVSFSTLEFIAWMHQRWLASRASVLGLFFNWVKPEDINFFKKIKKHPGSGELSSQTLVVFPDLWTLYNFRNREDFYPDLILGGWQNKTSLKKAFEEISIGKAKVAFATHSGVFQNWPNLKKITVLRPHMRYYKNQQQPRYRLPEVVEKMASIFGADVGFIQDFRIF